MSRGRHGVERIGTYRRLVTHAQEAFPIQVWCGILLNPRTKWRVD